MATAARQSLSGWRNEMLPFTIVVRGVDLTAIAAAGGLRLQVRAGSDVPGQALVNLATVQTAAAEGLKLDSVITTAGVSTSTITGRFNKSTMQGLPYSGEVGDDTKLAFAFQINGVTRIFGDFWALASAIDSDNAPINRPASYGFSSSGPAPAGQLGVTISDQQVIAITLDAADLIVPYAAAAQAAAQQAGMQLRAAADAIATVPDAKAVAGAGLVTASPNGAMGGPAAIFGAALVTHFDPHGRRRKPDGTPAMAANDPVAKIFGAGAYEALTIAGADGGGVGSGFASSAGVLFYLTRDTGLIATPDAAAGTAWLSGPRPFAQIVGPVRLPQSQPSGGITLWATPAWRLFAYRDDIESNPATLLIIQLQQLVSGTWTTRGEWRTNYANAIAAALSPAGTGVSLPTPRIAFSWSKAGDLFGVAVNGAAIVPTIAVPAGTVIPPAAVTIGPLPTIYAATFASDGTLADGERVFAWLQRPMATEGRPNMRPAEASVTSLLPLPRPSKPVPATIAGPNTKTSGLTLGATLAGNLPALALPANPNVAPFNAGSDRTVLWNSVFRICAVPHPDAPTDTTRVLALIDMVWNPDDATVSHYVGAFESTDSGASFTPVNLAARGYLPGANLPSGTSTTINNILAAAGTDGRLVYVGDRFPGGYTPPGGSTAFKYLFLTEYTAGAGDSYLYGMNNPLNPADWSLIPIRKHPWPHPPAANQNAMTYGAAFAATLVTPDKPNIENKQIDYDPVSGRFFLLTRARPIGFAANPTYPSDLTVRQMYIAWSKPGDVTRWDEPVLLIGAPDSSYQCYDATLIQNAPDRWSLIASNFAYWDTGATNGAKNAAPAGVQRADRNLRMTLDRYVIYPRVSMTPILLRADWSPQAASGAWTYGMIYAYPHPFNLGKFYVSASKGTHDAGAVIGNFQAKAALVDYALPDVPVPDRQPGEGIVSTQPFLGRDVTSVRIEANSINNNTETGVIRARIVDAQTGMVVPGGEFTDSLVPFGQIATWNGSAALPTGMIRIEAEVRDGMAFSGAYPQLKPAP